MKKRYSRSEVEQAVKGIFTQPIVPKKKDLKETDRSNAKRIKEKMKDWESFRKTLSNAITIEVDSNNFKTVNKNIITGPGKVVGMPPRNNSELLFKQLVRNIIEEIHEEAMARKPKPTPQDEMFNSIVEDIPSIMAKNLTSKEKVTKIQALIDSKKFAFDRMHPNATFVVEKNDGLLEKMAEERELVRTFAIKKNLTTILPYFYPNEEDGHHIDSENLISKKDKRANDRKQKSASSNSRKSRKSGTKR